MNVLLLNYMCFTPNAVNYMMSPFVLHSQVHLAKLHLSQRHSSNLLSLPLLLSFPPPPAHKGLFDPFCLWLLLRASALFRKIQSEHRRRRHVFPPPKSNRRWKTESQKGPCTRKHPKCIMSIYNWSDFVSGYCSFTNDMQGLHCKGAQHFSLFYSVTW